MKTHLYKVFSFTAIIFLISAFSAFGQTDINKNAEAQVNAVTEKAGKLFNEGLLSLKDNRRLIAGEKFDKSVEEFLYSTLNVQSNPKLSSCYNQLVETIYRIEFPSNTNQPNIRTLSAACGWNIDNQLADDVAKLVLTNQNVPTDGAAATSLIVANNNLPTVPTQGFNEQKFEASPLDELSKLELTQEEQQVENSPVAQQQYQYIAYAVSNKSLGFSFQVDPRIQQYINYYQGRGRGTMETGLYRSGMFMRMARRIFKEEGLPENVAWLAQVESMWKPSAMSWAAASGLWQFIPGTGTRFGLKRTAYVDERNSFEKATHASAQYLKFLANRYGGNWELAMAAYNSGEGNVDRAIARAGVSSFWAAYPYLPQETRNYVPNILATILIANNPQQYGFGQVRPAPQLMYDQIRVPASTNLGLVAQASDTSVEYLRYLNPELRTNMTPPEPYIIRVPAGKANEVVAIFKRVNPNVNNNSNLANSAKGETWENVSRRTGVSVADLMAANGGAKVPGNKVFVPQGSNVKNIVYSRPTNALTPLAANTVRVVKAQNGDTVTTLAARENVSAVEIAKFNGLLPTSKLSAGREIKIPTK
jgi:LysM repeat protein